MSLWGTALVAVIFVLLFLLERFFPLRQQNHSLFKRLISNVGVTALAFAVNATAVQFAAHITQQWTAEQAIGWCGANQTAMMRDTSVIGNAPTQMVDAEHGVEPLGDRQENYG